VLANDFGAGDNVQGESAGGVSPTFRITFVISMSPDSLVSASNVPDSYDRQRRPVTVAARSG
jgi:hypothetical protein